MKMLKITIMILALFAIGLSEDIVSLNYVYTYEVKPDKDFAEIIL